ncbi:hypothetical protein [Candidatus Bathycorpusculum sp.]|uniref:hypothetical protein n=1 Tax=Candidatus Bathycorpusculum sp. TaxID=2994959 RepID=UPI00282F9A12|nr:hypothetical protein [Candidatus Termitimicrobium sp.]MCL2685942.1 hypothetical protein [Candidatus Termitimicrobium sp.]
MPPIYYRCLRCHKEFDSTTAWYEQKTIVNNRLEEVTGGQIPTKAVCPWCQSKRVRQLWSIAMVEVFV